MSSNPGNELGSAAVRPAERTPGHFTRLIALNTGAQVGARSLVALLGVVQAGILTHYLHSYRYGEYGFVLSVVAICAVIADMGVTQVSVRALVGADRRRRAGTLGAALVARVALALVALIVTDAFALVAHINTVERDGILLLSTQYLVMAPLALGTMFQAELELHISVALGTAQQVLSVALTVILVSVHATLLLFLAAQLVTIGVGALAACLYALHRYRLQVLLSLQAGGRMLREAMPVGIGLALVVLYYKIDAVLLGVMRGAVDVAHYTAAYRFLDLGNVGAAALMAAVYPVMLRRSGEDRVQLVRAYQATTDVMMLVAIPVAVAWFILAGPMVFLIYPADFQPAVGALRILTWTLIPLFLNNVSGAVVLTLHRERTFLWVALATAVFNVAVNLVFIPRFGITAAAVITVLSELMVTVAALTIMWRVLHFFPSPRATLLAGGSSLLMAVPVYLLQGAWPLAVMAGSVVYAGVSHALGLWSWTEVRGLVRRA